MMKNNAMTQRQFDEFKRQKLSGKELFDTLAANKNTSKMIKERSRILGQDPSGQDIAVLICNYANESYLKYKDSLGNNKFKYISENKALILCYKYLNSLGKTTLKIFDLMRVFDIIEIYMNNYGM